MWLNPQSWSVISRFVSDEQAEKAMNSVHDILNTPYGAKLLEPPYKDHYFDGALMHIFNADTKENGGIFSQSQGWLILAESLLGHGLWNLTFMVSSPKQRLLCLWDVLMSTGSLVRLQQSWSDALRVSAV